ncbi:hypothetical protein C4J89_4572 [Pseudomonas sp. R4-35-07]|uniref:hypothetical protein n=1 Tax=unclassified Pseudomonas TaxID=196821 RepID=UPI000F56C720|nr:MULTISPECIES: hypothetical protein [unclassified Pseudomonas]AZF34009.1 hypothetical protein C4J89_4572 [Pseudomonas sp. R4-35-07]AZF55110.1 hypothetical protein C4J85_4663 [Pseudomonas sp. R4-34-07]
MNGFSLKSIDAHCAAIVQLFVHGMESDYDEEWLVGISMLGIASGVDSVNYSRERFDITLGYCESADDFSQHQEILESRLVTSLCRFNFIWSAVESIIDVAIPRRLIANPSGKINNACYFLKHNATFNIGFSSYIACLDKLKSLIFHESHYGKYIGVGHFGEHVSLAGQGIYMAYKLRNRLAHGSFGLPVTKQEDETHVDNEIVELCSRLVLYSIQILIMICHRDLVPTVSWEGEDVDLELAYTHVQYNGWVEVLEDLMQLELVFN